MHVHSYFSGPCTTPVVSRICRESYSQPEHVYERLRRCGMDLFTLTDHDSIEGAERLMGHGHFFRSEEVTCQMPSGTVAHMGVFDITEKQHQRIQRLRDDLPALLAYLSERRIFFSINHVFSSLTGARAEEDFGWFEGYFPAVETRNGHMREAQNSAAVHFARRSAKAIVGGSDAHALPSVGTAYTEVPGARDKEEFFSGLRAGLGRVRGEHGSLKKLTRDVFLITLEMMRERKWTALLSPLAFLIPVATILNYRSERQFFLHWSETILGEPGARVHPLWITARQSATEEGT